MLKTRLFVLLFVYFGLQCGYCQTVNILGEIIGNGNIENIHVTNKSSQLFTVTDKNGRFNIPVKQNDTLTVSSIQHELHLLIISRDNILAKTISINLEDKIIELDEVLIGKLLTGNLLSDINKIEGKAPINFFDVGIPGYAGKPATQSERRLYAATSGHLVPIINAITGKTKRLKNHLKLEEKDNLLRRIKYNLIEDFFIEHPLDKKLRKDFFYFCQEDINFMERCKGKNGIEILKYLQERLVLYKLNLKSNKKL